MSNKELVIQFLIDIYNNGNSNTIQIDRDSIKSLPLSEKEVIKILQTLDSDNLIIAKPKSPHKDFSIYWEITLNSNCLEYFNIKKMNKVSNRRDWIRTYVPIAISIFSLIVSIISLLISLYTLSHGM